MRVLLVTNHFWPEDFRVNDLAIGLESLGLEVTVLTGIPDYPQGSFHPGYGVFERREEEWKGIRIVRFPLIPRGQARRWNLVVHYLSSAMMSCLQALSLRREAYDVVFVFETSPVTIALPALVLRRLRSIPVVLWILDLWPESLSATGAVSSPVILKLVRRLVRFIYARCDRILVSSKGFTRQIEQIGGYDREPLYFPNWVEPEYLSGSDDAMAADLPELPPGFRIVFAGNIGTAQDFPTILAAAELLAGHPDIHWVILGDGRRAAWVREQVRARGLGAQVHLLGRFPARTMPAFFARAGALLLTLRRDPVFALTVPGKVQSYMASGRPVLAAVDGEAAALIDEARAGLTCPAESPEQLAERVLRLYRLDPRERQAMGDNGRAFAAAHFDRERQFATLVSTLREVAGSRPR